MLAGLMAIVKEVRMLYETFRHSHLLAAPLFHILTVSHLQVAHMFGCSLGLSDLMTGMSIVALGTSLPDTFASQYAAIHDDTAVSLGLCGGRWTDR